MMLTHSLTHSQGNGIGLRVTRGRGERAGAIRHHAKVETMDKDQESLQARMFVFLHDYLHGGHGVVGVNTAIHKAHTALESGDMAALQEACVYVCNHAVTVLNEAELFAIGEVQLQRRADDRPM
jgi:hypothetical protein